MGFSHRNATQGIVFVVGIVIVVVASAVERIVFALFEAEIVVVDKSSVVAGRRVEAAEAGVGAGRRRRRRRSHKTVLAAIPSQILDLPLAFVQRV